MYENKNMLLVKRLLYLFSNFSNFYLFYLYFNFEDIFLKVYFLNFKFELIPNT